MTIYIEEIGEDSTDYDPMTAWLAGWGRDFAQFLHDNAGDDSFNHAVAIDRRTPAESLQEGRSTVLRLDSNGIGQGLNLSDLAAESKRDQNIKTPAFFLLPLEDHSASGFLELFKSDQWSPGNNKTKPIIGVVDYAINVAHERFRAADGTTRVDYAWDQGGRFDMGNEQVPFGREITAADIDQALLDANGDEEKVLRDLGLVNFGRAGDRSLARAASHGTHVLDLAAGSDPAQSDPESRIIAVNLPAMAARETSGAFLGIFFLLGIDFILRRARWIGGNAPVFINLSLALTGGPRGGQHLLERSIDSLIERHQQFGGGDVTVIAAAGNRNQSQGHAMRHVEEEEAAQFHWQVQPGDPSSNMLDIWIAAEADANLAGAELELHAPDGSSAALAFSEINQVAVLMRDGEVIGRISLEFAEDVKEVAEDHKAYRLSIILAPTDPLSTGRTPAQPGMWTISVAFEGTADLAAWVMRDDVVPGFRDTGRQSYLIDPASDLRDNRGSPSEEDALPPETYIRHAGMMNALATGRRAHITTVGAAVANSDGSIAPAHYSSAAMHPDDAFWQGESVQISAVAERSQLRHGVIGASTASGSKRPMGGTSAAAPRALRKMAMTGGQIVTNPVTPPNARLGGDVILVQDTYHEA